MRKSIHLLLIGLTVAAHVHAQCHFIGLSVSASDSTSAQLYHPGYFYFGTADGTSGVETVCEWTVLDMEGNVLHEAETSGDWDNQSFMHFTHEMSVADSMRVELVLTNPLEEHQCCVFDTLIWEETQSPLGNSAWGNWSTETDGYAQGVECGTNLVEPEHASAPLILYPQPASESIRLHGLKSPATVCILDATGCEQLRLRIEDHRETVDIRTLPSGLYFLTLLPTTGPATMHRFIKE